MSTSDQTASSLQEFIESARPEIFYHRCRRTYWIQNERGVWNGFTEGQIRRKLRSFGLSERRGEAPLSEVEQELERAENENDIVFAGPLSGRSAGLRVENGHRLLVTEDPRLPEPAEGEFPLIEGLLTSLIGNDESHGDQQLDVFLGWLKHGASTLREGEFSHAQALAICGPPNCGKSLLQKLITELLAGRAAKGSLFMSGRSQFNSECFKAEHLMLEDEQMSSSFRAREAFATQIKNVTVSNDVGILHEKGQEALNIPAWWRVSISLNDSEEAIQVLPPLTSDVRDKIIILKAQNVEMPMPTHTAALRREFWDCLMAEVPAFLHFLLHEFQIQEPCSRFGVATWHHPEVVECLAIYAPEYELMELLDSVFAEMLQRQGAEHEWEGTASDLTEFLRQHSVIGDQARNLLKRPAQTGKLLQRIANAQTDEWVASQTRSGSTRTWTISRRTS